MNLCTVEQYGVFDSDFHFPGKKRSENRILTHYQIEYFISCTGKAYVDGTEYRLEPGCILCAKPGQTRRSDFGFRCYYVHFTFPENSEYGEKLKATPDFYRLCDPNIYGRIFEDLTEHKLRENTDLSSDFITAKLLELFYHLLRDADKNRNYLELFERQGTPFLPRVTEYVRTNYASPLSLKELADVAGYSPHYFHRLFTSVMGQTPQEYLLEVRIRRAKELLLRSDGTLAQIAYDCGFSSQSYFCMQFRKKTGQTPGQYRKKQFSNYGI